MKKIIISAALLVAGVMVANAEGYNRVSVSYDWQGLSQNKEMTGEKDGKTIGLNGFGLNYAHGFGVAQNMFVETGLNVNFGFGSEVGKEKEELDDNDWYKDKTVYNNINMVVPVNFVYRFNVTDDFRIAPYVGINIKLNLLMRSKYTYDSNLSMSDLKEEYGFEDGKWRDFYSSSEENMGDKDYTWNRFQMGWQVGVGFEYKRYYLGLQYGTDFIPAYNYKPEGANKAARVNSQALKLSLGFTF